MIPLLRRGLRFATLVLLLGVTGLLVPDSAVLPTEATLVRIDRAEAVDLDPGVVWILAVGSDARPGEDMTRTRADALQLVGINSSTGAATAIGIARDSWVPIAGFGSDRINASLYYGGPQLLAKTVGQLTGVQPDYVFVSRFPFFEDMVDDIGGITVTNPRPFADEYLKPGGFQAGKIRLNGYGAMAFARIRKSLPGGDFDRSRNQQRVLRGIQARVRARADVPGFLERGVLSVIKHTATDVGPAELFRLAQAVAQIEPSKITGCVVTGSFATIGGASVVLPDVARARRYGADARRDAVIKRC